MGKQEFLANGGFSGAVYDLRWPITTVSTGIVAFLAGKNYDGIVEGLTDPGKKRQAYWNAQAFKEAGLVMVPAGYVQQPGMQAGIASVLPGVQSAPVAEDKAFKMLESIEGMLKSYGERIARLEGKTETKPTGSS